jgi:hypothetical protein
MRRTLASIVLAAGLGVGILGAGGERMAVDEHAATVQDQAVVKLKYSTDFNPFHQSLGIERKVPIVYTIDMQCANGGTVSDNVDETTFSQISAGDRANVYYKNIFNVERLALFGYDTGIVLNRGYQGRELLDAIYEN